MEIKIFKKTEKKEFLEHVLSLLSKLGRSRIVLEFVKFGAPTMIEHFRPSLLLSNSQTKNIKLIKTEMHISGLL